MFAVDKIGNYFILDKYLRLVLSTHFINADLSKRGKYNFRCNVCGDSLKSKKKKRAWLLEPKRGKPAMFKCWNGCDSIPSEVWLKKYFPTYYREYIKEMLQSENKKSPPVTVEYLKVKQETKEKIDTERKDLINFIPIKKGKGLLFDKAISFCVDRKIPEKYWSEFFVCQKTDKFCKYADRLIIPFFDNNKNIYYFQARALMGQEPKYLNRTENKEDSIFNYYNIDRKSPVVVLEGPIDSMFIENSIALIGLGFGEEIQRSLYGLDCYYLLDNDKAGKDASKALLSEGRKVFLWSRFIVDHPLAKDCKDINDYILKYNINEILKFEHFSNKKWWSSSYYDSIYL